MLGREREPPMPSIQDRIDILESIRELVQQERFDEVLRLLFPEYANISLDVQE
jgi:hypothetical protein